MSVAEGILTARGGLVSHAAVVARGWGKPAVVGAEKMRISGTSFTVDGVTVREGDVAVDQRHHGRGRARATSSCPPARRPRSSTLSSAGPTRIRKGKLAVRANADNGPDATNARKFGAEGIGLCRTEHMFLGDDRLPIVRRMILADTPETEEAALEELRVAQKADFIEILEAMDGLPVTVRLLDPPLHEFLPDTEELAVKAATTGLTPEEQKLYDAAREWHEFNPMLGTRGVRLGVVKPGLYAMQVRALMEAAAAAGEGRRQAGGRDHDPAHRDARGDAPGAHVGRGRDHRPRPAGVKKPVDVIIGTMIETPRAALRADEIAEVSDFFSFGTNDLTQMTFGFSRDDVEGRMMRAYLEQGLLKRNPFETIDATGVGELVREGVERGSQDEPRS